MNSPKKIGSALISVYDKNHLEPVIRQLHALGVTVFATGGTQEFIEQLHVPVVPVEKMTGYPSILGGRVKTLHPKIFGGILSRRGNQTDAAETRQHAIQDIDLVVVDLYPFEETVKSGAGESSIIEKIDIGGISLIRAAAKNFQDVLVIPSRDQYDVLHRVLTEQKGITSLEERKQMAACAFNISSHYDTAIFNFFNAGGNISAFKQSILASRPLRYGENPHQQGTFFGNFDELFDQLHGKEISYNNLLDIDAAVGLMADLSRSPAKTSAGGPVTFAILKHNNACGAATRKNSSMAWSAALAADPVSAFGGVLITNSRVDASCATEINTLFFEILVAPSFDEDALQLLKQKKNRILLLQKKMHKGGKQFRSLLNGVAVQDGDASIEYAANMKIATKIAPTPGQFADLEFANTLVKHTKSNAIVLVRDNQLLASGTGQTSRVDALRQAIAKAESFGFDLKDSVMASDAFFPFPDCVEIAGKAGIKAVIQPGGSVRDKDSVDYCDQHDMAMVMTGVRHFRH